MHFNILLVTPILGMDVFNSGVIPVGNCEQKKSELLTKDENSAPGTSVSSDIVKDGNCEEKKSELLIKDENSALVSSVSSDIAKDGNCEEKKSELFTKDGTSALVLEATPLVSAPSSTYPLNLSRAKAQSSITLELATLQTSLQYCLTLMGKEEVVLPKEELDLEILVPPKVCSCCENI